LDPLFLFFLVLTAAAEAREKASKRERGACEKIKIRSTPGGEEDG